MDPETFKQVLTYLTNAYSELKKAERIVLAQKIKFTVLDSLLGKVDEAIFRWKSRP